MRLHSIACAAIFAAACSSELAERPAANDPGSVAAAEAPYHQPPSYEADPLLSPVPPKSAETPPTGHEQAHSPTATPPGNPPFRAEPGGQVPKEKRPPGTVYTCPMHPEVRQTGPGKCPKCGMTLVPVAPKGGEP
jgi:Cu+-exporting ATPase